MIRSMTLRFAAAFAALVTITVAGPARAAEAAKSKHTITIAGTRFLLDGQPFEYTGVSFFNAIFNPAFNNSPAERKAWLGKFRDYGINVLRIWGQWDNKRNFVDAGPESTLFHPDGRLREDRVRTLKAIVIDADEMGFVVQLCLFAKESRDSGVKLEAEAADRAVAALAQELCPYRNLTFQVWNEFSHRTIDLMRVINRVDPERLVTNSPGGAGVLGSDEENRALDYLTPHTSRYGKARPWEAGPKEIAALLKKFQKPVVDDEPARTGTRQFGGPPAPTSPNDHILGIWQVWQVGGYVTYHHDMFQTGYGTPAVPPNGIPDPEFSAYHRQVFEFLKLRERYLPRVSPN